MMNHSRYIAPLILVLALFCHFQAFGQEKRAPAFGDGEKLTYAVSYKVGFVNTDVAEVIIHTTLQYENGHPFYRIEGTGRVYPFYGWFFDMNDTYVSRLDARTMRPIDLKVEIREGDYRFSSFFKYDWDKMEVTTTSRNHKRPNSNVNVITLHDNSFDALALFFNLRNMDMTHIKPGTSDVLYMVLEDTVRRIQYKFIGHETRNIPEIGKFKTLKFTCQIATSTGESFKDGSEFSLWISDDKNKIPIYLESPIRIGSVRVRLLEAVNLRHEMTSRIK